MTQQISDRPRRPGILLLLFWLLLLGLTIWLRATDPAGDEGIMNAFTGILGILFLSTLWLWIVIRSSLAWKVRRVVAWGSILALGAFFSCMRLEGFSGAMIPKFVPRFASGGPVLPPEESVVMMAADIPVGAELPPALIDLTITSPTDFPGFLGADRLGRVHGVRLARDWAAQPPEVLWKQACGLGWSGFAVVNGVAITQEEREGQQVVIAYNVTDGAVLWSRRYGPAFDHGLGGPGPRATPTIADGAVVILGAHGALLCLEGATGEVRWERNLLADYGVDAEYEMAHVAYGRSNSPLVFDGMVVVPVGGVAGEHQAGLAAFDMETGATRWEGPPRNVSFSSPTLATVGGVRQVLIINEDTASGHAANDGQLLWEHPWPGKTPNDANCSQVMPIDGERVLITKGYGQGSSLLKLTPAESGTLKVEELWHNRRSLRTKYTNALLFEEHLYAISDGILECVSLKSGERVWKGGRYGHGQMLLVGDLLLILTEAGELVLVQATPDEAARELGRLAVIEGKTWNNLALAGDLAVVRNGEEAAVVRLPLAGD